MVRLQVPPSPQGGRRSASPMLRPRTEDHGRADDDELVLTRSHGSSDLHSEGIADARTPSMVLTQNPQSRPIHLMSLSEAALLRNSSRKGKVTGTSGEHGKGDAGEKVSQPIPSMSNLSLAEAAGLRSRTPGVHTAFTPSPRPDRSRRGTIERPQWTSRQAREGNKNQSKQNGFTSQELVDIETDREATKLAERVATESLLKDAQRRLLAQQDEKEASSLEPSSASEVRRSKDKNTSPELQELQQQVQLIETEIQSLHSGELSNPNDIKNSDMFGSTAGFAKACEKFGIVTSSQLESILGSAHATSRSQQHSSNRAPSPSSTAASTQFGARTRLFESPGGSIGGDVQHHSSLHNLDESASVAVYMKEDYEHINGSAARRQAFIEQLADDLAAAVSAKSHRFEVRELFPGMVCEVFIHADPSDTRSSSQLAKELVQAQLTGNLNTSASLKNVTNIKARGVASQVKPLAHIIRSISRATTSTGFPPPPPLPPPPFLSETGPSSPPHHTPPFVHSAHNDLVEAVCALGIDTSPRHLTAPAGSKIAVSRREMTGWCFGHVINSTTGDVEQPGGWFTLAHVRAVSGGGGGGGSTHSGGLPLEITDVTIGSDESSESLEICSNLSSEDVSYSNVEPSVLRQLRYRSNAHNADTIESRLLLEGRPEWTEGGSLYVEIVEARHLPAAAVLGLLPDTYCCVSLHSASQHPSERPLLGHSATGLGEGVMIGGHLVFNMPPQFSTGAYAQSTSPKWRSGTLLSESRPDFNVVKGAMGGSVLVSTDVSLPLRGQPVLMLITVHERHKVGVDKSIGGAVIEIRPGPPFDTFLPLRRYDGSAVVSSAGPSEVRLRVAYPSRGLSAVHLFLPSPESSQASPRSGSPTVDTAFINSSVGDRSMADLSVTERLAMKMMLGNRRKDKGRSSPESSPQRTLASRAIERGRQSREREASVERGARSQRTPREEGSLMDAVDVEIIGISGLPPSCSESSTYCCVSVLSEAELQQKFQRRDLLMSLRHSPSSSSITSSGGKRPPRNADGFGIPPQHRTRGARASSNPLYEETARFEECSCVAASRRVPMEEGVTRRTIRSLGTGGSVAVFVTVHESGGEDKLLGKALVAGLYAGCDEIDRFVVLNARHGQVSDPVTGKPAKLHVRIKVSSSPLGSHDDDHMHGTKSGTYHYAEIDISEDSGMDSDGETQRGSTQSGASRRADVGGERGKGGVVNATEVGERGERGGGKAVAGGVGGELEKAIKAREKGAQFLAKVLGKSPSAASASQTRSPSTAANPKSKSASALSSADTSARRSSLIGTKFGASASTSVPEGSDKHTPRISISSINGKKATASPTAASPVDTGRVIGGKWGKGAEKNDVKSVAPESVPKHVEDKVSSVLEAAKLYRAAKGDLQRRIRPEGNDQKAPPDSNA